MFGREKVAMLVAEFLGASVLSTVTLSMLGRTSFPFFVAVAAGAALAAMGYLFGAQSNPAVTIGLWTMRKVQTTVAIAVIAAQMLGGVAAWQLNEYLLNSELKSMASSFDWRIFVAEAVGAVVLGLGVAVAVSRAYKEAAWAVVTGVSLSLGILVASMASNALLNPAVAVGVQSWSWTYALAPVLGTVAGMTAYGLLYMEWPVAKTKAATAKSKAPARKAVAKKPARKSSRGRK
jgi:glycerol uptake facilitator-like aquaporin